MKIGLLLTNIGTPKSTQPKDVAAYLRRFLMDEDVISIPFFVRWPLVNLIIVPKRAAFSAANYAKVWMPEGSPLTVYSERFVARLRQKMDPSFVIEMGMSYSDPDIESAYSRLKEAAVDHIVAIPLYPQFAQATTGSALKAIHRARKKWNCQIPLTELTSFFSHPGYIEPSTQLAKTVMEKNKPDHWLFSFHGLPVSQLKKDPECKVDNTCCSKLNQQNDCVRRCYRAQCLKTAELMAQSMGLSREQWTVSFQSRLGKAEWIRPYTEETLIQLAQRGVKHLGLVSPAFVADCIETLEELAIGARETFIEHGGQDLSLVPCLNDDMEWIEGFEKIVSDHLNHCLK